MSEHNDPGQWAGSGAESGPGSGGSYPGAPSPYGANPSPYGEPNQTPSPSGPTPYGGQTPYGGSAPQYSSPYLQAGAYPPAPSGPGSARNGCLIFGAIFLVIFLVIIGVAVALVVTVGRTGSAPGPTFSPVPTTEDLGTAWLATPADLSPDAPSGTDFGIGLDGAFTGASFIGGESTWVVTLADADHEPFALVGIDAATGAARWEHDLPGVLCGDAELNGVIMCVNPDGDTWQGLVIDTNSGEIVQSWVTDLTSAATVHLTPAGLIVVGNSEGQAPHALISLLTPEATTLWSVDLADIAGGETLFSDFLASDLGNDDSGDAEASLERPRWRPLDNGLVMLWSTPGAAVIDPATGTVFAHECRRATVAGSAYFCVTDAGISRHALDGSVVWTLPGLTLAHPSDIAPGRPVAYDEASYAVVGVDWEAGTITHTLATLAPASGGFAGGVVPLSTSGSPEHLVVAGGASMIALTPDVDEIAWTWEPEDGGYIGDVYVAGDHLVLDDYDQVGLDPATGSELWTARLPGGIYRQVVGDQVATIGFDEIALLELP